VPYVVKNAFDHVLRHPSLWICSSKDRSVIALWLATSHELLRKSTGRRDRKCRGNSNMKG